VNGVELHISDDPAREAAELLASRAAQGGRIALSGGSTPKPAYVQAAVLQPDWSAADVFFGDERCVPPDDSRSNFRLVRESLLDRLERPPGQLHRIRGEAEPEAAAREYDGLLRGLTLDLVLLGVGPDGHTASLFPHSPVLEERERLAVAVPHSDVARVTLTPPALESAELVVFLATGAQKRTAVTLAFGGGADPGTPASMIRSARGRTVALLDEAAAAGLTG
jgi:6-phosphogluconolactonase